MERRRDACLIYIKASPRADASYEIDNPTMFGSEIDLYQLIDAGFILEM